MTCIIAIRTAPNGQVIAAQVTKSSGDPAFDRSAEAAVRKASPLPMPPDPKVAAKFFSFSLRFKP
jgi:colicin import membrane protein